MTVLIGLSFASPVLAFNETDTWNRDYTRNLQELGAFYVHLTPNCSSVFTPAGNNTVGGFYFAPQEHDIVLDSFDQVIGIFSGQGFVTSTASVDLSVAISETSGQLQVVNPSDIGHFSQVAYFADNIPTASKKFWTTGSPGNTGYGTSTFVAPTFPGQDLRVILKVGKVYAFQFEEADANPVSTDGGYCAAIPDWTIYSDATSTAVAAFPAKFYYGYSNSIHTTPCSPPDDYQQVNNSSGAGGWYPNWKLNGTIQDNGSHSDPVPTSTYDGTFSGTAGSIGFGTSTVSLSDGIYSAKFQSMFGAATGTFPLCLVSPWIAFMDVFQGFTQNPQSAGTIVISEPFGAGTTTLSLANASGTFAAIGLVSITDLLFPFLEALAWLTFGVVVFRDIFMKESEGDDTL